MHTSPDTLTLLALGESVGTAENHAHLAHCPVCAGELEELAHVVEAARTVGDGTDELLAPSPTVWANILAEISRGSTSPVVGEPRTRSGRPTRAGLPRRALALVLAAVLALAVAAGLGFITGRVSPPVQTATPKTHLNALPAFPGAEGQASIREVAGGDRVLDVSVSLTRPPAGRLEVWLSDERALHMISMGYLTGTSGSFAIPANINMTASPVVDVSDEPDNDPDPGHHSTISVVRGRLVR